MSLFILNHNIKKTTWEVGKKHTANHSLFELEHKTKNIKAKPSYLKL